MSFTAGVDIGGTKVLAAIVSESGEILERLNKPTDVEAGTASVISALEELLQKEGSQPQAIGVGVAAFVGYPSGRVMFAPNLNYEEPDVQAAVERKFSLPVAVENDANAAAWAEHRFGAGRGVANMLMVTVGTGVGGGIIVEGNLYRGSLGVAAEFGHMTILDGGPVCTCGERGCLEALASGTAIARMAKEGVGGAKDSILLELAGGSESRITGALVSEAARAFDEFAVEVLERAGRFLGIGLAVLTNAFDPEVIVIGGGGAESGDYILGPARSELRTRVSGRRESPEIKLASMGSDSGVIGAADLARLKL